MKEPVLVIMAAGMGSRYGGLKQIDPVDDKGHIIIDFSIYDAIQAGFKKLIFIIKKEIEEDFKEVIGRRMEKYVEVSYVFQDINNLPEGFAAPQERVKPWGTGHAILSCIEELDGPFAVINADDYYGSHAFKMIYDYLVKAEDDEKYRYTMVGYILENTLTDHGHVARGVCETNGEGYLAGIRERTHIERRGTEAAYTEDDGETWTTIPEGSTVSMNMWGFTPSILKELKARFAAFLQENIEKNPLKCEYFLPNVVGDLIAEDKATVKVLKSLDKWYGVTYKEDKEVVVAAIKKLKEEGLYPETLWSETQDKKVTMSDLEEVVAHMSYEGKLVSCEPHGNGHINDTFLVINNKVDNTQVKYILQRMNREIFKNPVELMDNISEVTSFLREKIIKNGGDPNRETLNVLPTTEGKAYYIDKKGNYWRSYIFIEDSICFDAVEKTEDFYQSAVAFGNFQRLLSDFPAHKLSETIVDFHNTVKRVEALKEAIEKDVCGRVKDVQEEIKFALTREEEAAICVNMQKSGELPLRVTHNDTKLNNIMMDKETRKALCIIDLDTVMPGLSINDFGDSIRFGASTGAEDEMDLSKISMSLELFEAYTKGFIEGCKGSLTEKELDMLPMGSKMMTYECGVRFLTDYLQGDTYFKIHREGQNLDRCRTQFKLVADMEQKWDQMKEIVDKYRG